jgi:hypothetical protein
MVRVSKWHRLRILIALWGIGLPTDALAETVILLDSQSGDPIGDGIARRLDETRGTITASLADIFNQGRQDISIVFRDDNDLFSVQFAGPDGQVLQPGVYENARGWPFQPAGHPGLQAGGYGSACNTLTGRFVVHEVVIENGTVKRFAADFEQRCDYDIAWLFGKVRFHSGEETPDSDEDGVTDPWDNCPSVPNSDQSDADEDAIGDGCDAIPAVTVISLHSEVGDYIGRGLDYVLSPDDLPFELYRSFWGSVSGALGVFHFDFQPQEGTTFGVGSYPMAKRFLVHDGSAPGMEVWVSGPSSRTCFHVTGRFEVLEFAVDSYDGTIQRLAINFEQHCNGAGPALLGAIRIKSDSGEFDGDLDGVITPEDNCPTVSNPDQSDVDLDAIGDACDLCPRYATSANGDLDQNGIGDECECGDQTGDAVVNMLDIMAISKAIFGFVQVTPLCDTNYDGLCNVSDIIGANQKIFGQPAYCSRYPPPVP